MRTKFQKKKKKKNPIEFRIKIIAPLERRRKRVASPTPFEFHRRGKEQK